MRLSSRDRKEVEGPRKRAPKEIRMNAERGVDEEPMVPTKRGVEMRINSQSNEHSLQ